MLTNNVFMPFMCGIRDRLERPWAIIHTWEISRVAWQISSRF